MATASATLSAHSGAVKVSRQDLALIPAPPRTHSFVPVPHNTLVELIENNLTHNGFGIETSEFAVQDGKLNGVTLAAAKLFATFVLKNSERPDFSFALGLRASNDKSLAIELCAGAKIFVCDNLMLSSEVELLWRKHTSGLTDTYLRMAVESGVQKAINRFDTFDAHITDLKAAFITDVEAKATIYDAAIKGVMPFAWLAKIGQMYFEPPHVEFEPRTKFSLHNAFTEVFRTEYAQKPHLLLDSTQELGSLFNL